MKNKGVLNKGVRICKKMIKVIKKQKELIKRC